VGVAGSILLITLLCACASSGGGSSGDMGGSDDPAAALLAQRDGSADVAAYSAALDNWQAKCTQDRTDAAGIVDATYSDLAKHGVGEASRLVVMRHLTGAVPASVAPTDCVSVSAAYLVLREK
jgi:hypothetical protein